MNYFRRTIEALMMASPQCLVLRYDDGLAHCVEASVSGAAALKRRKIDARAIPCAAAGIARDGTTDICLSIGLNPRQVYERLDPTEPKPPFDVWKSEKALNIPEDEYPLHAVIEAKFAGERAIIDLTIGELRRVYPSTTIPLQVIAYGDGWPTVSNEHWSISYMESPNADRHRANMKAYSNAAYLADLHDSIELALQFKLDKSKYYAELARQMPDEFATALARLDLYGFPGGQV